MASDAEYMAEARKAFEAATEEQEGALACLCDAINEVLKTNMKGASI